MFINKGKSFLNNTGIFISIFILIVFLLINYNKCYIKTNKLLKNEKNIETFYNNDGYIIPKDIRIKIDKGEIILNFNLDTIFNKKTPTQFMIILSQYDYNKKNTGNNKFYSSNEYELSSSLNIDLTNYKKNVCYLVNGNPICEHIFKNLPIRDDTNKLYYYKIGISATYDDEHTTPFFLPYNINTDDNLFTIEETTEEQEKQHTDFLEYQKNLNKNSINQNIYNNMLSTPDGKYELIKLQLGNYPDHLIIEDQTISKSSLSDLVDKTMAEGIVNINVKMNEPNIE